jgi:predicted RNA-binding protein YlxR (DUF448 family)
MTAAANAPQGQRRKGPRPKHVPQRMCIACRDRSSKRTLTRVVRTPEGPVVVDPTGKLNGRGAYLCDSRRCWDRAISTNILANALKTEIDIDTAAELRRHAQGLPERDESSDAVTQEG